MTMRMSHHYKVLIQDLERLGLKKHNLPLEIKMIILMLPIQLIEHRFLM